MVQVDLSGARRFFTQAGPDFAVDDLVGEEGAVVKLKRPVAQFFSIDLYGLVQICHNDAKMEDFVEFHVLYSSFLFACCGQKTRELSSGKKKPGTPRLPLGSGAGLSTVVVS